MSFGLIPWRTQAPSKDNGDVFSAMQREMNRIFEKFNGENDLSKFESSLGDWSPKVNVADTERELQVTAELPGVEEKDVEVTVDNGALTIKGEKKAEKEEKGKNYYRAERSFGSFERVLPLSRDIVQDKVEATFKNGVLTVKLPKTAEAIQAKKKIPVKCA